MPAALVQAGMPEYVGPLAPIGYADPHDTSALWAYRLPDWGYRTWNLEADLGAGGEAVDGEASTDNRLRTALAVHREGEAFAGSLALDFSGNYYRTWDTTRARSRFSLAGNFEAEGRRYIWRDLGLSGGASYLEYVEGGEDYTDNFYRTTKSVGFNPVVGVSLGRVRNVGPLLRAKRLSERLVALGRAPLQDNQLQWLAGVFATHAGYLAVYDREDRHFWGAVLADVAGAEPLTAYEVLYLREVLSEFLGTRGQGWEVRANYRNSEFGFSSETVRHSRAVEFQYAHNLDLVHYWELQGGGYSSSYGTTESREVRLQANFWWILANRLHWSNGLSGRVSEGWSTAADQDNSRATSRRLRVSSSLDYYLEDRLKLTSSVFATWYDAPSGTRSWVGSREWGLGIRMTWYFDRVLY